VVRRQQAVAAELAEERGQHRPHLIQVGRPVEASHVREVADRPAVAARLHGGAEEAELAGLATGAHIALHVEPARREHILVKGDRLEPAEIACVGSS